MQEEHKQEVWRGPGLTPGGVVVLDTCQEVTNLSHGALPSTGSLLGQSAEPQGKVVTAGPRHVVGRLWTTQGHGHGDPWQLESSPRSARRARCPGVGCVRGRKGSLS